MALAGGPGQAALPLGRIHRQAIAPALGSRDLLVFDQRGTGASDPLQLRGARSASAGEPASAAARTLRARRLGPARGAFTTQESVAGHRGAPTRRRLRKARPVRDLLRHEGRARVRRTLSPARRSAACSTRSCRPTAPNRSRSRPSRRSAGVSTSCARTAPARGSPRTRSATSPGSTRSCAGTPLSGSVYDGSGQRHAATLDEPGLLDILEAGDLNPALRALLPAAVRSALRNDPDPLLRLHLLSEGLIPSVPDREAPVERKQRGRSTKRCSRRPPARRRPFPWQRAAPPSDAARGSARLPARPAGTATSIRSTRPPRYSSSLLPDCAALARRIARRRRPPAPLPDVPTLILSGAQDLRTPTAERATRGRADPRRAAAGRARSPATRCSAATSATAPRRRVSAFFAGAPVAAVRGRHRTCSRRPR